ncbi:hypothetical protein EYC84_005502 [Monilinia fructicola]|uniref:Uncharacterized protein n=1 Tax=Monilinia fructicola TaxID=38448 RepID=A0A5M9JZ72_MONFR|nr:hypothetical protein EYC84_005502 [Monilinia fructicola]
MDETIHHEIHGCKTQLVLSWSRAFCCKIRFHSLNELPFLISTFSENIEFFETLNNEFLEQDINHIHFQELHNDLSTLTTII